MLLPHANAGEYDHGQAGCTAILSSQIWSGEDPMADVGNRMSGKQQWFGIATAGAELVFADETTVSTAARGRPLGHRHPPVRGHP